MAFDLNDCEFRGPALPEPFVKFELEKELTNLKLLPKTTGDEGRHLQELWNAYRRKLYALAVSGGSLRVRNHVIDPLIERLGYARIEFGSEVQTREDIEPGGNLLFSGNGVDKLRVWTTSFNEDLYAPSKRGRAYRFSHLRVAQRVLLATGERIGLLTNGVHLLLLISDPARPDSTASIPLDPGWKRSREVPDSFRLLIALACPAGVKAVPDLVEKARLQQARVTKELRVQARQAVERFIQEVLDHPANREWFVRHTDREALAKALWREGLIVIYRLLFILKLESSDDPARSFSFASSSLWRNTFSPSIALARFALEILERGAETGTLLEDGIRNLFKMFEEGLECTELNVKPLGGALFGRHATPTLSDRPWGERSVAWLLDRLLWTPKRRGAETRERVHYGPLDVEDLGRVYEALLELEPGISSEPMCRLRRQKLEVVVPIAQGEKYRAVVSNEVVDDTDEEEKNNEDEAGAPTRAKKTKVEWIEEIFPNRFYLRVGLGRKSSGSYYTPHSFVRFLVQETLGPQAAERSPQTDPKPLEILKLKVLDPAMGSGHFLVEACRFLGDKLYEACRLCDEKAIEADNNSERLTGLEKEVALEESQQWRNRVIDLPDPDDEMMRYLPSRSPEGSESGLSQKRAEALCRRLVATHCLYGVDKNPLAVELAKLSIWIESHAEGMPLTFLDHRLLVGDSLTGPFWRHLIFKPSNPTKSIENLFSQGLNENFTNALQDAMRYVAELEASVGISVVDIHHKQQIKAEMDRSLLPFRIAAAAWAGGVMLGPENCDDMAYAEMLQVAANTGHLPDRIDSNRLLNAIARGLGVDGIPSERESLYELIDSGVCVPALPYDLMYPEVFYSDGVPHGREGFHAVLGNPPWDTITIKRKEWFAGYNFDTSVVSTKHERDLIENKLLGDARISREFQSYVLGFEQQKRANDVYYDYQKVQVEGDLAGRFLDLFRVFMERNSQLLRKRGITGVVVPSAFHANEGATGIRKLYLEKMALRYCYSFENRKRLFEIHRSFKFALVVAESGNQTDSFTCVFYLQDDGWLFSDARDPKPLTFSSEFIRSTGGPVFTFLELRDYRDFEVVQQCYFHSVLLGGVWDAEDQTFSTAEINLNLDYERLIDIGNYGLLDGRLSSENQETLLVNRAFPMAEGRSLWHYDMFFSDDARYAIPFDQLQDRIHWFNSARYFRSAYRKIASSTNERTMIWVLLPPGPITSESCPSEKKPWVRPNCLALARMAILNSYTADFLLRVRVAATVSMFMLRLVALPQIDRRFSAFLCHQALRLQSQDARYRPLWMEQLGDHWREGGKNSFFWPVLSGEGEKWNVRASIDAVVADLYGLTRDQYSYVLSTFSHSSHVKAPELCLEKFDELKKIGFNAFAKSHDPYCDIPLNENLPKPVIELPIPNEEPGGVVQEEMGFYQGSPSHPRKSRKKRSN